MMKHVIKIPTERKWFRCPYCGKKLLIYDDTAKCDGVYINCRECKREVKIKINKFSAYTNPLKERMVLLKRIVPSNMNKSHTIME